MLVIMDSYSTSLLVTLNVMAIVYFMGSHIVGFNANLILNSLSSIFCFTIIPEESYFCRKYLSGFSVRTIILWV